MNNNGSMQAGPPKEVAATIKITAYTNAPVDVEGPLDNLPVMLEVLGKAMVAVAAYSRAKEDKRIVTPALVGLN